MPTDNEIIKALECCGNIVDSTCKKCVYHETYNASCVVRLMRDALDLITRQKAEVERLEIELKAMRGAANSYKAKNEALRMDYDQLQSDIICANQNNDHIKQLWETEKEKVAKAKQKVIDACKALQKAKAENEHFRDVTKKIKSEAYKEFAERLKAYFNSGKDVMYLQTLIHYGIDRIIKELSEVSDNA